MGIGDAFRELGDFLEECERWERTVEAVEVAGCGSPCGEALTVDVEVSLEMDPPGEGERSMAARAAEVGPDGTVRVELESTETLVPTDGHDVTVESTDATVDPDGTVTVGFSATASADGSGASTSVVADDGTEPETGDRGREPSPASAVDRDVPPFENHDLLADVYESCDTFAEMADALGMDVTAETVRRYMIDSDIHQPNSYRTGSTDAGDGDERTGADEAHEREDRNAVGDAESGQPVVLSDGIGLPDDVTVDTLIETVKQSNTIYEVKKDVGIDRQDALDMLQELNLLDLVVGRLATEAERDISREDIVDRLREASATRSADAGDVDSRSTAG